MEYFSCFTLNFAIFDCNKKTTFDCLMNKRKATGLKSRINYRETNHVTSKCQMDILDKTYKKEL